MDLIKNFIVIDTEGRDQLREIAIINAEGELIYEAFSQEDPNYYGRRLKSKPLVDILADFQKIASEKVIICHNANHDIQVLKNSFKKVSIDWQNLNFQCSLELAKNSFPNLPSYSLEYLSKQLGLKVNHKYFNPQQAHAARYDAEFTYQLYRKIMDKKNPFTLANKPNPFGSNRVDNPFQTHPDLKSIYQGEFARLKSTITDIKYDENHQSKGVVIIGEPGSGKTHLIMRLAQELLKINRLLFIRSPNNPNSVLYHTYSQILQSFVQPVPGTDYTQFEHLLAHSFVKLISRSTIIKLTQKDIDIQKTVKDNPLNLYKQLGGEGTQKKREFWDHIKKRILDWWLNEWGASGYYLQILTGIIEFCRYTDPKRRNLAARWLAAEELSESAAQLIGLENWNDEISKEEFSLQAISVFSKLSLLDEPLIIVFDQLESLGYEHRRELLLNFGEAVKEMFTHVPNSLIILNLFPERWQQFQYIFDGAVVGRVSQQQIYLQSPSQEQIKDILKIKLEAAGIDLNVNSLFAPEELEDILQQKSIRMVLNRAADYYNYKVRQIPVASPPIIDDVIPPVSLAVEQRLKKLEKEFIQFKNSWQEVVHQIGSLEAKIEELQQKFKNGNQTTVDTPIFIPPPHPDEDKIRTYLVKQKEILEREYNEIQFINDNDDLGKLTFISEAFEKISQFDMEQLRLGTKKIPEHLVIKKPKESICIAFLQVEGSSFTARISNFNQLVNSHKNIQFILWRDVRQPNINGKVGKQQIAILNSFKNGEFRPMEKEDRIHFELIYKLIIDIENRDFEVHLEEALKRLSEIPNTWLIQLLGIRE
ncbi:exonuclease domain-containing protein [Gloeothece verrucosa]|uniref:Exonuclease RNase T and DNA polymerase III n=1 Tax=Gloeothece verrucosa (strain PCC 7822) TaxID=497965 RepID=E0UKA9_GLOV7|nr:exonuclease domain-containing protein [Gloeothece verrucosa]ADN15871.1 Exonuclease RNase T and DNA polymerase III [Gloeothece verrucosa PCC 7822]